MWLQIWATSKLEDNKYRSKKYFGINKIEDMEIIEKIINL